MEKQYAVTLDGQAVGRATVQRQGLYYRMECRCALPDDKIYSLRAVCGNRQKELGIFVPSKGGFEVNRSVPVKQLGEGALSFAVVQKYAEEQTEFYLISQDEPFAHIDRLLQARLRMKGNRVGVTFIP